MSVTSEPTRYADPATSISNLVHAWNTDPRYSERGSPRELPLEGAASLETLIECHKGGLQASELVRDLVRLGVVEVRPGRARARALVSQFYLRPLDELSLDHFACVMHDVGQAAGTNVFGYGGRRFERRAIAYRADPDVAAELRAHVSERIGCLFDEVRNAMRPDNSPVQGARRVGFGVYEIGDE